MQKLLCKLMAAVMAVSAGLAPLASWAQSDPQGSKTWTVPASWAPRPANEPAPELLRDPQLLAAFVERELGARMSEARIPGAVFVAVKDGEVIFQKGYGYADIEKRTPVDPDTSMFFVASVSKIFLGLLALRLEEKGLFELDDDVSELAPGIELDKRLMNDRPVTVRQLLTHSSGFPETFLNSSVPEPKDFIRVGDYLGRYMPAQTAAPDALVSYCSSCIAGVGAVIESVTGKPYEDVLDTELFRPLGMTSAGLVIPLNKRLPQFEKALVTPYTFDKKAGTFRALPTSWRLPYPSAGMAMSGASAAKLIALLLNNGAVGGQTFLPPEAAAAMLAPQARNHPLVPGFGIAFKEGVKNGVRYVGHSGDYRGNDSMLTVLPDYGFGFFISYTGDNSTFYRDFFDKLMNEAFKPVTETVQPTPVEGSRIASIPGHYTDFRFRVRGPMSLVWPLMGTTEAAVEEGLLTLKVPSYYFRGGHVRYVEVKPDLFRLVDVGPEKTIGSNLTDYLYVKREPNGSVRALTTTIQNHTVAMAPLGWIETRGGFLTFMLGMLILLAVPLLFIVGRALARVLRRRPMVSSRGDGLMQTGVIVGGTAVFLFLGLFYSTIMSTPPENLQYGLNHLGLGWVLQLTFLAPVAIMVIAVALLQFPRDRKSEWWPGGLASVGLAMFVGLALWAELFAFALRGGAAG